jgi:hypothetical protein
MALNDLVSLKSCWLAFELVLRTHLLYVLNRWVVNVIYVCGEQFGIDMR